MSSGVRPDQLQVLADKHGVDAAALAAAVNEEFARRGEERKRRREERLANPAPGANDRYRAIREGTYKPLRRPRSSPEDRDYVPGALHRWRTVHGLSQRQAQQRIGLSASAQTWHMYETGVSCPPYRTLLKILAATGLGHIADVDVRQRDADLELDILATESRDRLLARRRERARLRDEETAAAVAVGDEP